MGPGDFFGFWGNFLYGLIPYKAWALLSNQDPVPRSIPGWLLFAAVVLLASAACGLTVGWGINLLGFHPFVLISNIVITNNFIVAVILSPFLLAVLYPRVDQARLLHNQIMAEDRSLDSPARSRFLLLLLAVLVLAGLILGNLLYTGVVTLPFLPMEPSSTMALEVGLGLLPIMILIALCIAFL